MITFRWTKERFLLFSAVAGIGTVIAAWTVLPQAAPNRDKWRSYPFVRAAYQICLDWDVPIAFMALDHAAERHLSADSLEACQGVLSQAGFESHVAELSFDQFNALDQSVVVVQETGVTVVAKRKEEGFCQIDYPNPPRLLSAVAERSFWPRRALVIDAPPPVNETSRSSSLVVSPRVIDFGCIDAGGVVEKTFLVSNPTKLPVTIRRTKTSCGCTRVEGDIGDVAPGATRGFTVRVDTNSREGFQRNFCALETDDGTAILVTTGFVRVEAGFFPSAVDFGIVDTRSPVVRSIVFQGPATSKLSVKVPLPLSYKVFRQGDETTGLALDRVTLFFDPGKVGEGAYEDVVEATFGDVGNSRHVRIPVRASVVQRLTRRKMLLVSLNSLADPRMGASVVPGILAKDVSSFDVRRSSLGLRISRDRTGTGELLFRAEVSVDQGGPFEADVELSVVEGSREVQYMIVVIVTGEA